MHICKVWDHSTSSGWQERCVENDRVWDFSTMLEMTGKVRSRWWEECTQYDRISLLGMIRRMNIWKEFQPGVGWNFFVEKGKIKNFCLKWVKITLKWSKKCVFCKNDTHGRVEFEKYWKMQENVWHKCFNCI